jgi:glycogen debranching enzyme
MGPFLTAYCKVNRHSKKAREQARKWLVPLEQHLSEAGLGQISEIFDADPPHRPRGCFAQAWSVAEVLRPLVEDVLEGKKALRTSKASGRARRSPAAKATALSQ